jgi:hypothetical protein
MRQEAFTGRLYRGARQEVFTKVVCDNKPSDHRWCTTRSRHRGGVREALTEVVFDWETQEAPETFTEAL